MKWISSFMVY